MTRLFLAGAENGFNVLGHCKPPYVLSSFYYLKNKSKQNLIDYMRYIKSDDCKMFLLDSGAFTFMEQARKKGNFNHSKFDEYVNDYADFIKKWDIDYYFEMDVDVIVGIEKVEQYRRTLERKTGKKSIPVFHKSRGKQYWLDMIKQYDYVSIGGIVTGEFKRREYPHFKWFIQTAHKENCKVHGLGFTSVKQLKTYDFDTVDSTSWKSSFRFGNLMVYDNKHKTFIKVDKPDNMKMAHHSDVSIFSMNEWVKFVRFLERHNKNKVLKW